MRIHRADRCGAARAGARSRGRIVGEELGQPRSYRAHRTRHSARRSRADDDRRHRRGRERSAAVRSPRPRRRPCRRSRLRSHGSAHRRWRACRASSVAIGDRRGDDDVRRCRASARTTRARSRPAPNRTRPTAWSIPPPATASHTIGQRFSGAMPAEADQQRRLRRETASRQQRRAQPSSRSGGGKYAGLDAHRDRRALSRPPARSRCVRSALALTTRSNWRSSRRRCRQNQSSRRSIARDREQPLQPAIGIGRQGVAMHDQRARRRSRASARPSPRCVQGEATSTRSGRQSVERRVQRSSSSK